MGDVDPLRLAGQVVALAVAMVVPIAFALRLLHRRPDGHSLGIVFVTIGVTMFVILPIMILLVFPEMR